MPVTIHDVAKRLHVSITTISRALDGYADVAPDTRARVIRTAREMGYVPSRAARQLRRQRADIVGYVLPTAGHRFTDRFFSEFVAGLGDEASSHKFDLLVSTAAPDSVAEKDIYTRWVQSRLVDGFVLSRMRRHDWRVRYLSQSDFPFVAHGRTSGEADYPFIEVDSRTGFRLLVDHLVERGHKRIAYIGASRKFTLEADRFAGYEEGLAAAGLPVEGDLLALGDLTRSGGYQAARELLALPNPPTAILGVNDLTALGALRAAHEAGRIVGRDLAVAGYDGTEDSEHAQPPLTTLKQPVYDTARQLATMLFALIKGEELAERQILLQPELIVRESTAFPVVDRVQASPV